MPIRHTFYPELEDKTFLLNSALYPKGISFAEAENKNFHLTQLYTAAAPATISDSSCVMDACLALL